MATTSDIKNGLTINYNGGLWTVVEFLHVKPGKGPAFVRTKLKNLDNGKIVDNTFNAGIKIDPVRIETRKHQFLYKDDTGYHFMNLDDYEQVVIPEHMINAPLLLKEEVTADIMFHADEERPLNCEVQPFLECTISYTEPGVKGDTATNSTKPATIDNGCEIRVPLFINVGDVVKVDTRGGGSGAYVERIRQGN
ncbi:MAG: elongation factor P [Flavobacteriales bacterium]|nr:elongation factor P [Flavobacteriales bacterium]NNK80832.1 elongation factor P [Flavobacteriales bacterium]